MTRLTSAALLAATMPLAVYATTATAQATSGDQSGTAGNVGTGQSAASSTNAPAPDTRDSSKRSDADIVVTARRVEERLQDVPISITVFNQAQLSARNVVSANDLATYTPSLSANSRFGNETSSFAIRGFVQEAQTAPSVAVYFADVVAPRAQDNLAGGNTIPSGAFFDLQNVQVLKGPQGTLFGRNTTGGAVLLVPQRPTDKLEGYAEGSYGNYDMRRAQAVINIPVSDTFKVRLGVDRMKRDGYIHNRSGIGPSDFNDIDYLYVRGSVVADLTPDLENYTVFDYARSNTNGNANKLIATNTRTVNGVPCQPGLGPTGTPIAGVSALLSSLVCTQQLPRFAKYGYYDVENSNPDAHLRVEQLQFINTTTWRASDVVTIKNIASYTELRQNQSANLFGDNIRFPTPSGSVPFGYVNVFNAPGQDNTNQYTVTEELQLQGRAGDDKLVYQLGAYYENSGPIAHISGTYASIFASCANVQTLACNTGPLGFGFVQNTYTRYHFRNLGFYGQATYKFTDQLSLTGGLRYTIDRVRGVGIVRTARGAFAPFAPLSTTYTCNVLTSPNRGLPSTVPDDCTSTLTEKSNKPTWLIDLDYKPTPDALLYAKYTRGYRQGGVNPSNTVPITWGPEKVDSYEVGGKVTSRGAISGYLNVAGFYNDFSNQQLQVNLTPDGTNPTASPSAAVVNAGRSKIKGIEVEAMVSPAAGLRFSGGYTYLDTKLKSYSPPNLPGFLPPLPTSRVGGDLALSPHHKLTISGSYTLPLDQSIGEVTVGATYTYTSSQIASADSPYGTLPSTNLVNLNASWNGVVGLPVDLSAFVTNLTKERYPVYVGGTFYSAGFETIILGQSRMYGLRLRYRFGH